VEKGRGKKEEADLRLNKGRMGEEREKEGGLSA